MTDQEKLNRIQAIQDKLYDLYREPSEPDNPAAVVAGQLAWEAVRLFWYAVRSDLVGVSEKFDYVLEAVERVRRLAEPGEEQKL